MSSVPSGVGPASQVADNVRRFREAQRLTLGQLAERSGVATATLSRVEAGTANPRLETLWALATTFGVPLGDLVASPGSTVSVTRGHAAPVVQGESVTARMLQRGTAGVVEVYELRVDPRRQRSLGHAPGTAEAITCVEGSLRCGPERDPVLLERGDHARFDASEPHVYEAIGQPARAILLMLYPS